MCKIQINGKIVEAEEGTMLLDTLRNNGIKVPTLCNVKGLSPTGACRMCVVEVEGMNNLVPSCAFPVSDGMSVKSHSPRALEARRTIIELLLSSHPDDCNYCSRNGSCELQSMAVELGIRQRRYKGSYKKRDLDVSNPAIVRDPEKCILCGRCVRVCEEIQHVAAIDFTGRGSGSVVETSFNQGLNVSSCVNCGQCLLVCPTGALVEKSNVDDVMKAIMDKDKHVVLQHAPSVSVSLAEEFGVKAGKNIEGELVAAARIIGFDRVFDTSFSADLTIMEEAAELVDRVVNGGKLPMMTSCSPGWIKFVEQFYPEFIDNLSTCKSPQQMMGAIIKSYYAQRENINPENIISVAVMPCTAKKFEASRNEMTVNNIPDVDYVLTTREFAKLIRCHGINIEHIAPEEPDTPFGERSSAGKLFGASGGVMEAAIRTAYFMITGKSMTDLKVQILRGQKDLKETSVTIGDKTINVAAVSGLENAQKLLDDIKNKKRDYQFIEVMTCPGGCINGGGQPFNMDIETVKKRASAIYNVDKNETLRQSHENRSIKRLYDEFLIEPLSHKSHVLLHTKYMDRSQILK
ncbi:MAG: iron hydrogenase small subunit [Deltaproteobacteria bacterium]|nr:iron hydrogenase small subunit [Deltaproteobacteria bacterium]